MRRRWMMAALLGASMWLAAAASPKSSLADEYSYGDGMGSSPAALSSTTMGGCFAAALSGANEVPPVTTSAAGVASLVLSPDGTQVAYTIRHTGIVTETMAHIHKAAFGVNGPVVVPFALGALKIGTFTVTAQLRQDMLAGNLYVNIHSAAHTGGEIRGQVVPSGGCFAAAISGANENPPVTTNASGAAVVMLSPDGGDVTYAIQHTGIVTETMAHFHKAAAGTNGPVIVPLSLGVIKTGSFTVTAQLRQDILDSLLYINVHSAAHTGGEIRGQVIPASACYSADLSGTNEIPFNGSNARGRADLTLGAGGVVSYHITHTGIVTETMAHIHEARIGTNGPVKVPFMVGTPKDGSVTLTKAQQDSMVAGLFYVNVHSAAFTGGEIRGQVVQTMCANYIPQITTP